MRRLVSWPMPEALPTNIGSGIFGMNRHPSSFMGQFGARLGGRFSYCFAPVDAFGQQPHMFLRFGDDIPHHNLMYHTPLIQGPRSQYYLDLRAISINGKRLKINPSVFRLREDGSGGSYISSGSRDTWLIGIAYDIFENALRATIRSRDVSLVKSGRFFLVEPKKRVRVSFPAVTFHFANRAEFVIQEDAYMESWGPNFRLTIYPSDNTTILGARQQVNHRIIYDLVNSELQFAPTKCQINN